MKVWQLSTLAVFMLGLSACGSSGGKDYAIGAGSGSSSTSSSNTSASNTTTSGSSGSSSSSSGGSSDGGSSSASTDNKIDVHSKKLNMLSYDRTNGDSQRESINVITIDGKDINILPSNAGSSGWFENSSRVVNGSLSNARWGYIRNSDTSMYMFSQGTLTPVSEMPTTGTARYRGQAIYAKADEPSKILKGNVSLTASFADKSLKGSVTSPSNAFEAVPIQAGIWSNQFSGATGSGSKDGGPTTGTVVSGSFFGKNAEEVSGVFYHITDDQDAKKLFSGAFGAKKQ